MQPYYKDIEKLLKDEGIVCNLVEDILTVDRTSMVVYCSKNVKGLWEEEQYQYVLELVRDNFPKYRMYWAGKTDDYLVLECYKEYTNG